MSWLEIATLALLPAFLLLDYVYGARGTTRAGWWRTRAFAVTAFNFWLSLQIGELWGRLLGGATLFDLSALNPVAGAAIGVLAYELVHYGYHRSAHRYDWLWRLGHQMHHSAENLDAWGAYYLHPVDAALFTTWSSVVLFGVCGLAPEAGAIAAAFLGFNAVFQHANIRTPRWLGWIIQRPESHMVHHQRGVHAYNYSDLPLWDIVFGTFRNPATTDGLEQGFYRGASARVVDMLLFRDVSRPPANG
jgi:sterol desaturase/sphingolipid hydroxylase (fatty acid hydroxylase superfamily)